MVKFGHMNSFGIPERPKEEKEKLEKTIKLLVRIFADLKIEYRVFGSAIPTVILGRPQRKLGDIDLMLDLKGKDRFFKSLKEEHYQLEERKFRFLGVEMIWAEALTENLFDLTIFLGNFDEEDNFIIKISKNFKVVCHAQTIKPTIYSFAESKFIGIPAVTGYYGALASQGNPKRKYDLAVFKLKKIERPPKGYSPIDFYFKEIKLPFVYPFSCFLQDVLGRISIILGGKYDFWKR